MEMTARHSSHVNRIMSRVRNRDSGMSLTEEEVGHESNVPERR